MVNIILIVIFVVVALLIVMRLKRTTIMGTPILLWLTTKYQAGKINIDEYNRWYTILGKFQFKDAEKLQKILLQDYKDCKMVDEVRQGISIYINQKVGAKDFIDVKQNR